MCIEKNNITMLNIEVNHLLKTDDIKTLVKKAFKNISYLREINYSIDSKKISFFIDKDNFIVLDTPIHLQKSGLYFNSWSMKDFLNDNNIDMYFSKALNFTVECLDYNFKRIV